MKNILHLISSPRGGESFSIKLGEAIIEKLQQQYPDSKVEVVDLLESGVPHLHSGHLRSFFTPEEQLTPEDEENMRYSDNALRQLFDAEIIVIGAPLYNFSIPSTLKSWIDHIARAGKTFRYDENGAEGLLKGKKVYIALSAGAVYTEEPWKAYDFVTPYLTTMLGFLGMTDVTIFRVEGLNIPGIKDEALDKAIAGIRI